jgi:hypothetical protein
VIQNLCIVRHAGREIGPGMNFYGPTVLDFGTEEYSIIIFFGTEEYKKLRNVILFPIVRVASCSSRRVSVSHRRAWMKSSTLLEPA